MSNDTTTAQEESTNEQAQEVTEEKEIVDNVAIEHEDETAEEVQETQEVDEKSLYDHAKQENDALRKELEEIKASDANVFAENEDLKKKVEEAKRIKEMSAENAKLKEQLKAIKKADLIANMTANGQLSVAMSDWAESQNYENLEAYAKIAPKHKTIIHQKNPIHEETEIAKKFLSEQNKGRIL